MHKLCVKCNKKCVYCGLPKAEWYGPECSEAPHVEVPVSRTYSIRVIFTPTNNMDEPKVYVKYVGAAHMWCRTEVSYNSKGEKEQAQTWHSTEEEARKSKQATAVA